MFKELKLKNLGDYHYLHVQSDTLLLADVFQNFRNKRIEIFELDMLAMLIPVQKINERIFACTGHEHGKLVLKRLK